MIDIELSWDFKEKKMIAKKIKAFMERRGITAAAVSRATGIPAQQLSETFNDRRTLKADEMMAILAFLEVSAEEIQKEGAHHDD